MARNVSKMISSTTYPNGLGISGYDRSCRTHFSTLDCGKRGIGVVLQTVGGKRRYMDVTGVTNHMAAYEYARIYAQADE